MIFFLSNMLSKSVFPFKQLDHHQNCNINRSGKKYVYHLSYASLPLHQFHIHLCLSISFHIAGTFISDLRSPLKVSKRRSVKRQKQYPILAECLIQWSRDAEEKKEKYYSFFFFPVQQHYFYKLFPTIHLVVTSQLLLTDGKTQTGSSQSSAAQAGFPRACIPGAVLAGGCQSLLVSSQ